MAGSQVGLVMASPAMALVERMARLYAKVPNPIVLIGPVGSGKTALARWIHHASGRGGQLVEVAPGNMSADLVRDMLFGHVPGAFTGAGAQRRGLVAKAGEGTVLVDDLALLAPRVQPDLLRVLEAGCYLPNGADDERKASCRFLFATTRDPYDLVEAGRLLPDLESRMGEFRITVPPLADRREDIMPIAMQRATRAIEARKWKAAAEFQDSAVESLLAYDWPNNIRELESVIDLAVTHAGVHGATVTIRRTHLPERLQRVAERRASTGRLDRSTVQAMLRETRGNQSEAARRLKVHRNTIRKYAPGRESA